MAHVRVIALLWLAAWASACVGTIDDPTSFQTGAEEVRASGARELFDASEEPASEPRTPREPEASTSVGLDAGTSDASSASLASDAATESDSTLSTAWPADARAIEAASGEPLDASERDAAATDAAADAGKACDFRGLIGAKCGSAGCHGGAAIASGLDLTSDKLAARLAGKKASGACASYLLIDTQAPERSALYLKVSADACGSRMPLGGTLTDEEQRCILRWIQDL